MIIKHGMSMQIMKKSMKLDEVLSSEKLQKINSKDSKDTEKFLFFLTRAITADVANSNGDLFPKEELKKSYETFVGKGLYTNHENTSDVNAAVGKIIDAYWIDEDPNDCHVLCLCKVSKELEPTLCKKILAGIIDSVSMGCCASTSKCSICGKEMRNMEDFCSHMAFLGREISTESGERKKVVSINSGITFTELSLVANPADETAKIQTLYASADESKKKEIEKIATELNISIIQKTAAISYKDCDITVDESGKYQVSVKGIVDSDFAGNTIDEAKAFIDGKNFVKPVDITLPVVDENLLGNKNVSKSTFKINDRVKVALVDNVNDKKISDVEVIGVIKSEEFEMDGTKLVDVLLDGKNKTSCFKVANLTLVLEEKNDMTQKEASAYMDFTKKYLQDNPGASIADAAKAWKAQKDDVKVDKPKKEEPVAEPKEKVEEKPVDKPEDKHVDESKKKEEEEHKDLPSTVKDIKEDVKELDKSVKKEDMPAIKDVTKDLKEDSKVLDKQVKEELGDKKVETPKDEKKADISDVTEEWSDFVNDPAFDKVYKEEGRTDEAFEDDGFIHVVRNGLRFSFYNGQEKDALKDKDIPRLVKVVEKAISNKSDKKAATPIPPKPDDKSLAPNMKWVLNRDTNAWEQKPSGDPTVEVSASKKVVEKESQYKAVLVKGAKARWLVIDKKAGRVALKVYLSNLPKIAEHQDFANVLVNRIEREGLEKVALVLVKKETKKVSSIEKVALTTWHNLGYTGKDRAPNLDDWAIFDEKTKMRAMINSTDEKFIQYQNIENNEIGEVAVGDGLRYIGNIKLIDPDGVMYDDYEDAIAAINKAERKKNSPSLMSDEQKKDIPPSAKEKDEASAKSIVVETYKDIGIIKDQGEDGLPLFRAEVNGVSTGNWKTVDDVKREIDAMLLKSSKKIVLEKQASAFDKVDRIDITEDVYAIKDKETKDVILRDKEGKEVARIPDAFCDEIVPITKLLQQLVSYMKSSDSEKKNVEKVKEDSKKEIEKEKEERKKEKEASTLEITKLCAEITSTKEAFAQLDMKVQLEKKQARCRDIAILAFEKGLIELDQNFISAELKKQRHPDEVRKDAITLAIDKYTRDLMKLDDSQIVAQDNIVGRFKKIASKVSKNVLDRPFSANAEYGEESSSLSTALRDRWSRSR